jgi:photosystem II stability/assembly factor-like uncharacterized protein
VSIEVDDNNIYVISNQNVHRSPIGNYSWTKIADFNFDNDAVLNTDITQNYLQLGTLNGLLLRVNLTTNVTEEMNDFANRIYSFDMVTDDLGYFTVQNFVYPIKTTDGGLTYSDLDNLPENIGVRGYGDNVIMTVNTNRIYVSTDGGQTSKYIPIPDDGSYDLIYSSYITDDGVVYFSGNSSMIAKTEDFGGSFINLNDYKRENLVDIEVHSSGTGVAVGGYSSVIKTDDGGDNWALVDLYNGGDGTNYLNSVVVISKDKYLVAGSNSLAIVENDQITSTVPRGIDAMIYNAAGGYLVGLQSSNSDYSIIKSIDGGLTWESKAFVPGYSYHISQAPGGKIYVPGLEGDIYTSTDGGDTWDIEEFGEKLEIRSFEFFDENLGLGSTGLTLYMTTDGGQTASIISSGYIIANMQFITEDHIVYTTANEAQTNIYESIDGGASFQRNKLQCSETRAAFRDKNNVIWLAQKGGHINKYDPLSTSTINIENNNLSFFPNPISKGQKIKIESEETITEATIISFSGRTVKQFTATHNNILSTQGLPTGMYTLSVRTNTGESKIGKLVIIE